MDLNKLNIKIEKFFWEKNVKILFNYLKIINYKKFVKIIR